MLRLAAAAACLALATANMYDVVMPKYTSTCSSGCMAWKDVNTKNITQADVVAMFAKAETVASAGASCAMPANHSGNHECDCGQKDAAEYIYDSYQGPWCFCKDPAEGAQYCSPPKAIPEQINLQLAAADVVVVGFVTYEDALPAQPPVAMFGTTESDMKQVEGVSHWYTPPGRDGKTAPKLGVYANPYVMSYVKFNVAARTNYVYKVKSGGKSAAWSEVFTFRSPYKTGITRVATYGDMGHSHFNNMQNMKDDCAGSSQEGKIDAIVHMGDHAYDLGMSQDRRGDAYMNALQGVLTSCPWFPIIGNHEGNDGDHFGHYESIAWGEAYGNPLASDENEKEKALGDMALPKNGKKSTATTALGEHLTTGTLYGMGMHGTTPSNTSRYASTDIGLIHMVGLDLNKLDEQQLAWLNADLTAANKNRANVPWIMVMSHFPVFHSKLAAHANHSLKHYLGDENMANYSIDGEHFVPCPAGSSDEACPKIGPFQATLAENLQPIFKKYGVDIYNAGHVHSYETTWPMCDFTTGETCGGKQDFVEPKGTMHITEGNGGVPGVAGKFSVANCSHAGGMCRKTAQGGAYGRITAFNSSTLLYEHVQNNGGAVTDSFHIVQSKHGPFADMK